MGKGQRESLAMEEHQDVCQVQFAEEFGPLPGRIQANLNEWLSTNEHTKEARELMWEALVEIVSLKYTLDQERARWKSAMLLLRGRLLFNNPHAVTKDIDELLCAAWPDRRKVNDVEVLRKRLTPPEGGARIPACTLPGKPD